MAKQVFSSIFNPLYRYYHPFIILTLPLMDNLRHIISKCRGSYEEIIYALFCKNDKFYVGHTINLESRMKYGHFGKFINRVEFLKRNPPLELVFIIETGITYSDRINIHDLEDYVTVLISKKYGADNVFGGFRHIKSPANRIKFVEDYDNSAYRDAINIIKPKLDFELPEIYEIKRALFGAYQPKKYSPSKSKIKINEVNENKRNRKVW